MSEYIALNILTFTLLHWFGYLLGSSCLLLLYSCVDQRLDSIFTFKFFKNNKFLSVFFICALGSIMGVPPFLGFWTKLYILYLIGVYGPMWLNICMWVLVILSLLFYITLLGVIFGIDDSSKKIYPVRLTAQKFNYLCIATVILCISFIFLDQIILGLFFILL